MRSTARAALLIVSIAAAGIIIFVVARLIHYPFWAFGARARRPVAAILQAELA